MKYVILAVALFLASVSSIFAQEEAQSSEERATLLLGQAQKDVLYFGRLMAAEIHWCVGQRLCLSSRTCPVTRKVDGATVNLVFMLTPADLTFAEEGRELAYRVAIGFKGSSGEISELPIQGDGHFGRPIPLEQVQAVTEMLHAGRICVEFLEQERRRLRALEKSS